MHTRHGRLLILLALPSLTLRALAPVKNQIYPHIPYMLASTEIKISIVVPCFNEASRIHLDSFTAYAAVYGHSQILFVDDGSTDATSDILTKFCENNPAQFELLSLEQNVGKAEAVRHGLLHVAARDSDFIGFLDADLATPLIEANTLCKMFESDDKLAIVFGSRVLRIGADIQRNGLRHYGGRVIATMISMTLNLPIYDTQCGAKFFRNTPQLVEALFTQPFISKWLFDVEIFFRFIAYCGSREKCTKMMLEHPLNTWTEKGGSKISLTDILVVPFKLIQIAKCYR